MDLGGDRPAAERAAAQPARRPGRRLLIGTGALERLVLVALKLDVLQRLAEGDGGHHRDARRVIGPGDRHAQRHVGTRQLSTDMGDQARLASTAAADHADRLVAQQRVQSGGLVPVLAGEAVKGDVVGGELAEVSAWAKHALGGDQLNQLDGHRGRAGR